MDAGGWAIGNLDCTLIAEAPRLAPYQAAMEANLATLLATPRDRVNLKLKSSDGMGALGRGEGMAALAVVLIEAVND
jgi:2-C-methyl-D-erythritol 2,4-cyclodiphosphate synthase